MIWIGIALVVGIFLFIAFVSFDKSGGKFSAPVYGATSLAVVTLLSGLWIAPKYNVWQQGLAGEADLAKAGQTKSIMIETARAEKEAATLRADAIAIMGAAAKNYPEYRQQEFMQAFGEALREGNISQIIYVPTEANIPVLEAGKR